MKKGDIIERRKEMPKGTILIRQCPDEAFAENQMLHIEKHYNFKEIPRMAHRLMGVDGLCVVLEEESYLTIQSKVNWVVDNEVAIEYLDTGGMVIFNLTEPEGLGWVVVHESTPVYQDSVEHMTDEQLRESIEVLRSRRLQTPSTVRKSSKSISVKQAPVSEEDKALSSVLSQKSPEERMELMRKLGLID
jgi:hypothetical protein